MNKIITMVAFILILSFSFLGLGGCGKAPAWLNYYNNAVEILGNYPHTFTVFPPNNITPDDWTSEISASEWNNVKGLTIALGYGEEWYPDAYGDDNRYYDFIYVRECRVYIVTPDVPTIFHEMVHVWDYYHYGLNLTEAQTSYLACLLMIEVGYESEAEVFYEESMERSDCYSFAILNSIQIEYVEFIFSLIVV